MQKSDQPEFKGLKDWEAENKANNMETFCYFTHCTPTVNMSTMQNNGVLRPLEASGIWQGAPLARTGAPKGSWFSMTLYEGKLPTRSPYGDCRLRKDAKKMIKEIMYDPTYVKRIYEFPRLFLETVVFHMTGKSGKRKRTARLILVHCRDDTNIKWCQENCDTELDLLENPFMTIIAGYRSAHTCLSALGGEQPTPVSMETHNNEKDVPDTWVELLVPYDVDITNCSWDEVEKI